MPKQCLTCRGVYEPQTADGLEYYHACPPVLLVAVTRAGAPLEVFSTDVQPTDTINVLRAGAVVPALVAALEAGDQRLGDRLVPRPDARDENIDPAKPAGRSRARAEGKGTADVRR